MKLTKEIQLIGFLNDSKGHLKGSVTTNHGNLKILSRSWGLWQASSLSQVTKSLKRAREWPLDKWHSNSLDEFGMIVKTYSICSYNIFSCNLHLCIWNFCRMWHRPDSSCFSPGKVSLILCVLCRCSVSAVVRTWGTPHDNLWHVFMQPYAC